MRVAILYYSASGTTKLVCEALRERLSDICIELFDIKREQPANIAEYDVLGFAFFADLMRPSAFFTDFVSRLEGLEEKPAFVLNTFGSTGGIAPVIAYRLLQEKGLVVFASHSLHTPESFPPMIKAGFGFANHPTPPEMRRFEAFVIHIGECIRHIEAGGFLPSCPPKLDLIARLAPRDLAGLLPRQFGPKKFEIADEECVRCGRCVKQCPGKAISLGDRPGKAISLGDRPGIDLTLCQQCWSCYNACHQKAIRVGKLRGEAQYGGPSASLRTMLLNRS